MRLTFDPGAALVAGGSGAIGSAVARRLSRCGLTVALTYHRGEAAAQALVRELGPEARARAYAWGSAAFDDAVKLVARVNEEVGPVRYLVACSGVGQERAFHLLSETDARAILEANVVAVVALVRAVATSMMKAGTGRIVLIGSVAGRQGMAGQTIYAASKAALEGLTRSLAREAGGFGVTVNCVAPGFIESRMTRDLPGRVRDGWLSAIPVGRPGRAEEVADLVAFIASSEAAYLNGQTLVLDGGLSA
jgi:3-oxoacyl-[acyl-carrier protein] reductase